MIKKGLLVKIIIFKIQVASETADVADTVAVVVAEFAAAAASYQEQA